MPKISKTWFKSRPIILSKNIVLILLLGVLVISRSISRTLGRSLAGRVSVDGVLQAVVLVVQRRLIEVSRKFTKEQKIGKSQKLKYNSILRLSAIRVQLLQLVEDLVVQNIAAQSIRKQLRSRGIVRSTAAATLVLGLLVQSVGPVNVLQSQRQFVDRRSPSGVVSVTIVASSRIVATTSVIPGIVVSGGVAHALQKVLLQSLIV